MPKGSGYSIEEQVTGEDKFGGIQMIAFAPKKEKFDPIPPPVVEKKRSRKMMKKKSAPKKKMMKESAQEMSLSAGGKMKQDISKVCFF